MLKICQCCDVQYNTYDKRQKYCSRKCARAMNVQKKRELAQAKRKAEVEAQTAARNNAADIIRIAALARKERLTYGQYVDRHAL